MTKTLYSRIVLVFISIILVSLITATSFGLSLFQQRINQDGQTSMLAKGNEIIELYQKNAPNDSDTFFQQMANLTTFPIHLYDKDKQVTFFSLDNNNIAKISKESIDSVLQGNSYQSKKEQKDTYVGLPIQINNQPHAIFLQFSYENEAIFNKLLLFIILTTLIFGSFGILIASRFLVSPLKKLKEATDNISTGDFEVTLDVKRNDEVGQLARSFNQMTDELKQIETMRQDFVSNVSHEIQSPLTSISGFAKALKNEQLITDEQRPYYLDIIISESDRLSRLGDNLLKLASLDSEQHPFHLESFDVIEQIRQTILTLEPQWTQKEITVTIDDMTTILIEADYDLLQQVWLNLMSNAIKFTPEKGTIAIKITLNPQQTHLNLIFSDSGIGISEDDVAHIFDRFYKSDKSRSPNQKGNGLGLSIVKKIITLHHGCIVVKSIVGKGTSFTVSLPIKKNQT